MTVEEYNKLPLNEDILIKYSYEDEDGTVSGYYVVNKLNDGPDYYGRYVLTEAGGEGYADWDIEVIDDWVLCKELDKFFEEKKEPCDTISRKAAQAKIKSICNEYGLSYEDGERKVSTGGSAYALGHALDDLSPAIPTREKEEEIEDCRDR